MSARYQVKWLTILFNKVELEASSKAEAKRLVEKMIAEGRAPEPYAFDETVNRTGIKEILQG